MYTEDTIKNHPLWLHTKTGNYYFVVGVSTCGTNGEDNGKEAVIYYALHEGGTKRRLCHRDKTEFLDGRFVPCAADGKSMLIEPSVTDTPISYD